MSYKIRMAMMGVVLGFISVSSQAAVVLVDNFNEYTNASYIGTNATVQFNPGGASGIAGGWVRYGNATLDGIYSIAGGASGRGGSYSAGWSPTATTGSIQYNFSSVQNLSNLDDITLDINVNSVVLGTTVALQIRSGSTYFQTTTPLSLVNTAYNTFTFDAASSALTRVAGAASYESVLGSVDALVFVFANTGGTGTQSIRFDNLNLVTAAVPEPSTVAALGLAGLLLGGRLLRRRNG